MHYSQFSENPSFYYQNHMFCHLNMRFWQGIVDNCGNRLLVYKAQTVCYLRSDPFQKGR